MIDLWKPVWNDSSSEGSSCGMAVCIPTTPSNRYIEQLCCFVLLTLMQVLVHEPAGTFIVRISMSQPGSLVLSAKAAAGHPQADAHGLVHAVIQVGGSGFVMAADGWWASSGVALIMACFAVTILLTQLSHQVTHYPWIKS